MRLAAIIALAMSTTACAAETAPPRDHDVALTVYSSAPPGSLSVDALTNQYSGVLPGYALVADERSMTLTEGRGEVRFTDVAKRIDPTTVAFASVTDPAGTRVIEQNFQFDLVSAEKLRERYLGERIKVEQVQGDQIKIYEGVLLAATDGLILQLDSGEVVTLPGHANVILPSLPGGLIVKPTLVWLVDAKQGGSHRARVAYQTQGMTWWADYNVILHGDESACTMDLSAWVTVVNRSGATYPQAKLKLVAGEVNRAPAAAAAPQPMMKMQMADAVVQEGFQEAGLFEYHLYTLGRRTDVPDNSTKQLELFPAAVGVKCTRQLVFTASPQGAGYWGQANTDQNYAATATGTVGAYLEFENAKENGLGLALPGGRVRVNQAGPDGNLEFIGEDLIAHTPRSERLKLKLGEAFDVVGDRKQTNFQWSQGQNWLEESFEISVRNRKTVPQTVVVREYMYRWSKWQITQASDKHVQRDAQTADFTVTIPPDAEKKITYTVRYSWP